jgi:maltose O-acetyltransferase
MKSLLNNFFNYLYEKLDQAHNAILKSKIKCGQNVQLRDKTIIYYPENLVVSDNVAINSGVTILAQGGVTIGEYSMIAPGVIIISVNHDYGLLGIQAFRTLIKKPVTIGKNVWIAAGSIILAGITIGDGAVICAGSVVTKDVPPFTLVSGVPAKVMRKREKREGN